MNEPVIRLSHVTKRFLLPHERRDSLKEYLFNVFRRRTYETITAADDLSLEIQKGEFVGIIGPNGAGKSTLLKLIAGVYAVDSGTIEVHGKIAPFIELGVGLHPELSGKNNVFLYGALLGMTRKELEGKYEDIVEFAELGRFMDQKVKNYSSGMQMRLAFSITAYADADILLVDEALAVGDEAFQKKSLEVMENMHKTQKTILFVSHDLCLIETYCRHLLCIENGKIVCSSINEIKNLSRSTHKMA